MLLKNIKINNLTDVIKPFNYAVFDKKEKIKIYISKHNTGGHSIYCKSNKDIEVFTITLKEIFENNDISKCDLLKIDTEGSEYKILYGLPKNYFTKIKRIHLEYHDINKEKYNHNYLMQFLLKNGFKLIHELGYLFAEHI